MLKGCCLKKTLDSADELQARFMEIGLPETLMVQLQVTDYDLGWDAAAMEKRERFLQRGHVLVVDRRSGVPITSLAAPRRLEPSASSSENRTKATETDLAE